MKRRVNVRGHYRKTKKGKVRVKPHTKKIDPVKRKRRFFGLNKSKRTRDLEREKADESLKKFTDYIDENAEDFINGNINSREFNKLLDAAIDPIIKSLDNEDSTFNFLMKEQERVKKAFDKSILEESEKDLEAMQKQLESSGKPRTYEERKSKYQEMRQSKEAATAARNFRKQLGTLKKNQFRLDRYSIDKNKVGYYENAGIDKRIQKLNELVRAGGGKIPGELKEEYLKLARKIENSIAPAKYNTDTMDPVQRDGYEKWLKTSSRAKLEKEGLYSWHDWAVENGLRKQTIPEEEVLETREEVEPIKDKINRQAETSTKEKIEVVKRLRNIMTTLQDLGRNEKDLQKKLALQDAYNQASDKLKELE